MIHPGTPTVKRINDLERENAELLAQLDAAKRDAERWMCLRKRIWCSNGLMLTIAAHDINSDVDAQYVDSLADAALSQQKDERT